MALDPTPRQERLLESNAGAARFAYNAALAKVRESLESGERFDWSYYSMRKWWNANKDALAVNRATGETWWRQNSKESYNHGLESLAKALSNWVKSKNGRRKGRRVGFPKFKAKDASPSRYAYTTGIRLDAGDPYGLKLPRIGRVHCLENVAARIKDGTVSRITVSKRAGRWHASLTVNRKDAATVPHAPRTVGVDLGIKNLATLSDGTTIANPKPLKRGLKRLRKAQKALSRKTKGSNRRRKARLNVAKLHRRIADMRSDALHKLTTRLAKTYSDIHIEDLNVSGMVRNHALAQSVQDASFFEFRRQLEYKTARTGAKLHVVNRWYPSSKMCSNCGTVKAKLSLGERTYHCEECGLAIDRDLNAAININVAGSAPETLNARGGNARRVRQMPDTQIPVKREPSGGESRMRLGAGLGNETVQTRTN